MKRNWIGWLWGFLAATSIAVIAVQDIMVWRDLRSGHSPVTAFTATQQVFWRVLLNPWVFTLYFFALLILLWHVINKLRRERGNTINFWLLGAVLAAFTSLIYKFVQSR
jgi:hypothetical protein